MLHKISPTLKVSDRGAEVVNLQDALLLLIDRDRLSIDDPAFKEKLLISLTKERDLQVFGDNGTLILVQLLQKQYRLPDSNEVDQQTADALNKLLKELGAFDDPDQNGFVVRGHVTGANGDHFVIAYDKDFRSEQPLGKSPIDSQGNYEIRYTADKFKIAEKGTADLRVAVCAPSGRELVSSEIKYHAGPETIISLTVGPGPVVASEYERYLTDLESVLQGVALIAIDAEEPALKKQDLDFLAGDTGIDRQHIAWLVQAAVCQEKSKRIDPTILTHVSYKFIPAAVFYGWFRLGLPTDLAELWSRSTESLISEFKKSLEANLIPRVLSGQLAVIEATINQLKAAQVLEPAPEGKPLSLGELLAVAVDREKRQVVANYFVQHGGATDTFWKALEEESGVPADEVKALKQTMVLGTFTDDHLPLVRELYQMGKGEAAFAELRGFAQLDETEWQAVLQRPQQPGDANGRPIGFPPGQESIESYARTLNQAIENAFPTAVISNRLERDNSNESPFKAAKSDLLVFFANNPEFSFTDTPPDVYLSDEAEKLRDIEHPEVLRAQLKTMQRVFNVTPRFSEMRALLADDLHSATAMVYVGERRFTEKYGEPLGGVSKAREVYKKAAHVHATALNVYMKHAEAFNSPTPYVISGKTGRITDPQTPVAYHSPAAAGTHNLSRGADWRLLFGSLDLCNCQHCLSLYSPAAYLVDILKFLDGGPVNDDGKTPLDVLLNRRPDIEHIELTCENTNTQLPYVDLANEILEAAIAPRSFEIAEGADINAVLDALDKETVPAGFPTAFANKGYSLTDKASVRLADEQGDGEWIILDSGWAFSLKHQGANKGFRGVAWPQTSWAADELRANPEHIHDPAYATLRDAVYPWNLPLNLPLEEARAYLGHLGVPRHEVMETLLTSDAASDHTIALEYLGLAQEEANIITGVTTGGPVGAPSPAGDWDFWGLQETGNDVVDRNDGTALPAKGDWDVVLQRVSIFLQQSGLSYQELLELLGTSFINPAGFAGTPGSRLLGIVSAANAPVDTCNLSKLEIQVLVDNTILPKRDALIAAWNRMHRFVRLWRKLGWTMRDLDRAITAQPKNSNGELDINVLLKNLSHIQRLHVETGLPVVNLLAWWADIDTGSYVDQMANGEPMVASLYAQLFSNRTVSGQLVGENPSALSGTLSGKAAAIAAALQIGVEDFTLLQAAIPNDGVLTLANLSLLYRHATLAKALKLPIRSYLTTLELIDSALFTTPASTIQFIKHIDKIRASGFTIEDLDYLLRNKFLATSDIDVTDDLIATVLDAMRDELRKVSAENTFIAAGVGENATADPNGELTRKKLALLNWDPALIEQAIAVLNDTFTYETILTTLAPGVLFPESLKSRISYDSTEEKLRFTGTMTAAERTLLVALPNTDALFIAAVNELSKGPKDFVKRYMARFSVPVFAVPITDANLKLLLAQFKFPETLKSKIYYDTVAETLHYVGVMTEAERSLLLKLATDNKYSGVIHALFAAPGNTTPSTADPFLTSIHGALLFDNPTEPPQARFSLVLKELLPHVRTTLSEVVVKQRLGEYLKLDASAIDGLLEWVKSPGDPQQKAIADFLDPLFIESNPHIGSSKGAFPDQFSSFLLFHKIAILILKFRITPRQLQWLFDPKLNVNWLDLNALPLGATASANSLFQGWERLADLFQLRDALPRGEALLTDIFTTATAPGAQLDKVLEILSEGTQWELASLKSLSGSNGFDFSVSDFAGESAILRLSVAFAMLKRLGASANQCLSWAKRPPTGDDARELRSVVRAKYDAAQWLDVAKALRDPLRERQRSALVASLAQKLGVRDANELYERFLIDVEMSSCMMTTRIKQAISSVQLFIQRCFMNLESDVSLTPKEAKEWAQWRKWYRVWEANRKVLFYPENWIEPELRDDKSPFYKDLENELLQSDVTMATAEDAFLHYLEKLDQVARLEIVGMYLQKEQSEPDILHVFGRTYAIPHIYFYRRLEDKVWSAWEKLDLDIEGDHLIPVAWNRRLYLFWAIFTEKSEQPTKDQRARNDDPNKYWEIKLAWSEYKNKNWSPKKISKKPLRHNKYPYSPTDDLDVVKNPPLVVSQEPQDFSFKTRVLQGLAGEQLSIECYGTIVQKVVHQPAPPPTPAPTVNTQFLGVLVPHFNVFKNPEWTYLKCRFLIGARKPNQAERATTRLEIRDPANNLLEPSIPLNSNGVAYSRQGYTKVVMLYLVSDGYELESSEERGSWWFPFNLPAYVTTVVEACFDALADSGIAVAGSAVDTAISAAVIAAVASAGNLPVIIAAVIAAVIAAAPNTANVPSIVNAAARTAAARLFGRGMSVKLKARTPPPAIKIPDPVIEPTPQPMRGIGEFMLDDCNGDIVAVPVAQVTHGMVPTELVQYSNTKIQSMQFVENSGEYALITLPPGRGDHILSRTPGVFRLLAPHQDIQFTFQSPFFFQDGQRVYFVSLTEEGIKFAICFHPQVCSFTKALNRGGIPALLTLENQQLDDHGAAFWTQYSPAPLYQSFNSAPKEDVDFEYRGAYSLYNWELFFHTPFLIATRLSKNQRFEEAQKWFHYIFDPTATDSPGNSDHPSIERFWRMKPFYDEAMQSIQTLAGLIADSSKLKEQVSEWEANPFKPHVIARMRVVAYMKAVVMRYIDNLVAWGDQLFRRDTLESINEATQLYILAGQILGRRPESIPARVKAKIQTFHTLDDKEALNSLSNAMVEIESFLAPSVAPDKEDESAPPLRMRYFCITGNDKLLGYWDTVADRLFKIRHCMNIEGVERSLPIFEPSIDPGLLMRAVAAGIDISSVLNDINAAVPHYRFNVLVQKASELCNDVKALGGAFLSALEKRDAEALALLRSGHEVELLKAIRKIKEQQIEEANNTLEGLMKYEDVVTIRQQYYLSRPFMNPFEEGHIGLTNDSITFMGVHAGAETLAAIMHLIPDAKLGFVTTAGTTYGGSHIASGTQAFGSAAGALASMKNTEASLSATLGGYERRQDDWTHQADLATKELQQVKKQIIAAEIRLVVSELELQNHDQQVENAKEVDEYMRHQKFTNHELYNWMVGQLSGIYFQSYQLAYDVAKRAERNYRYELGLKDSNYIQFGYWDSLKKGLLSGERMHYDLRRMEIAYLDQNKREHEITKHISLVTFDPTALIKLKQTGECFVSLPEALFDTDYAGHYLRRIKSMSVTVPCVTGPYTGVNCTLTLVKSSMRTGNMLLAGKYRRQDMDARFTDSIGAIQSIVTSGAQNDSGMFEPNFRDERYLPFEGAGAISEWRIELPQEYKQFDYDTISDVVLHVRYTARGGGAALKRAALTEMRSEINELMKLAEGRAGFFRLFSARHEFPTEWHRFLNPADLDTVQTLSLELVSERFPFQLRGKTIKINRVELFVQRKDADAGQLLNLWVTPAGEPNVNDPTELKSEAAVGNLLYGVEEYNGGKNVGKWILKGLKTDLAPIKNAIEDLIILCHFTVTQ